MERRKVDFVAIGGGPAGHCAAIQAAKLGKKALIIERNLVPGGNSLNSGTIPSKSLREAILDLSRYNERSFYGSSCVRDITIGDLTYRLNTVLEGERAVLLRQYKKNGIEYLHGEGHFLNPNLLEVCDEEERPFLQIEGEKFLIATGSEPRNPMNVPFDDEVILDSTRLLSIDQIPKTMLVLGGGVIGAEYASFFAALGTKVEVLDKRKRLLPDLDAEIGIHLQVGLQEIGLVFHPEKTPDKIQRVGNQARVHCEDGSLFQAEVLLYALGRTANVQNLSLSNTKITTNSRGYIPVNAFFQTEESHIYAGGDVIGYPALASTSAEQGRLVALHAFGEKTHPFPTHFPLGIYTIPEISTCGYTEEELKHNNTPYEVGRAYYYEIARSHISGSSHIGLFKILFHKETLEVLGIHIVGRNATENIHTGQVAMSFGAKLDYFVNHVFNYPTFAEGYRIAALNGLNKINT